MGEAVRALGVGRRPIPSEAEIRWLHENLLRPLIDAVNYCPAEHRGQHVAVIMHTLLIGLPREDRIGTMRLNICKPCSKRTPWTHTEGALPMQPQQQQKEKVYRRKAFSVESEKFIQKKLADLHVDSLDILDLRVRNEINKQADKIAYAHVYGEDAPRDSKGGYREQGLGSALQPTKQSVDAHEKFGQHEPNFVENLQKMRETLARYQAKRAKEAADAEVQEGTDVE
jgi:hypothetical protein